MILSKAILSPSHLNSFTGRLLGVEEGGVERQEAMDASSRLFLPLSSFPPVHHGHMKAKACWDPKVQNHLVIQTGCADTSRMTVVAELQGLEGSIPPFRLGWGYRRKEYVVV